MILKLNYINHKQKLPITADLAKNEKLAVIGLNPQSISQKLGQNGLIIISTK